MKKSKKQKKREKKAQRREDKHDNKPTMSADALDGHGSIRSWEEANGRGFWGSASKGYIYDDD